jgi:hypothetical protein
MPDAEQKTEGLSEVVIVARGAVEQEFQVSERLDAKARGQVTLAGQWFAIVQAVSAVAFAAKAVEGSLLYVVGALALAGGALLARTFWVSSKVWKVRDEDAVHPHGILQLKSKAEAEGADAMEVAIQHYASILQSRRGTNRLRVEALEKAEWWWPWAMGVALVQLGFALAARLFG